MHTTMGTPLDRTNLEVDFEDDFDGPDLDDAHWIPHYLPHWSTPDRTAPATRSATASCDC